jgi:drug/metabolite transporter (DMT)-like permease
MEKIKRLSIFVLLFGYALTGLAQPGGGGSPGGGPPVPITGIEYLVGGGVLMGLRYLFNRKKDR